MYTEIAKSSTRAALPAAAGPPEYTAAAPTLASRIPNSVTNAALTPRGTIRHSASHQMPASRPRAATSIAGCGPESPSGIGSGGSRSAAPKNSASHREGSCKVHQSTGAITAGAASRPFSARLGAIPIAAPHTPKIADAIHQPRCSAPEWCSIHPAGLATARKLVRATAARRSWKLIARLKYRIGNTSPASNAAAIFRGRLGDDGPLRHDAGDR